MCLGSSQVRHVYQACDCVCSFAVMDKQTDVVFKNALVYVDGTGVSKHKTKLSGKKGKRSGGAGSSTDQAKRGRKPAAGAASSTEKPKQSKKRNRSASCKEPVKRHCKKTQHAGRLFLMRDRSSKKTVWVPLKNAVTQRGSPGPAEKLGEISEAMKKRLRSGCYLGADAGPAIQSMAQQLGVPASAAVHSQEVFTPLVRFAKKDLTPSQVSFGGHI